MTKNLKNLKNFAEIINIEKDRGFGLVDAILSMSLLLGVITYGVYFSSVRLSTVYAANLTRSINKEIQRDIERLKSSFWCMYFEGKEKCEGDSICEGQYCSSDGQSFHRENSNFCRDYLAEEILNLKSWNVGQNAKSKIQSWKPGPSRSKVFKEQTVTITRELTIKSPLNKQFLDKSIANIDYRVQWGETDKHWLTIYLSPEAHSWCDQVI